MPTVRTEMLSKGNLYYLFLGQNLGFDESQDVFATWATRFGKDTAQQHAPFKVFHLPGKKDL